MFLVVSIYSPVLQTVLRPSSSAHDKHQLTSLSLNIFWQLPYIAQTSIIKLTLLSIVFLMATKDYTNGRMAASGGNFLTHFYLCYNHVSTISFFPQRKASQESNISNARFISSKAFAATRDVPPGKNALFPVQAAVFKLREQVNEDIISLTVSFLAPMLISLSSIDHCFHLCAPRNRSSLDQPAPFGTRCSCCCRHRR